jgi:hypothetical protein
MRRKMKTLIATTALTVMFLSAGAFAGSDKAITQLAANPIVNVTVISKNSQWPVLTQITTDACSIHRCIAI